MTKFVFLLTWAAALHAQSFSFGAKGGSPLNDPSSLVAPISSFTNGRWTGGPTVELHLPLHFSIEFDALFRNSQSTYSSSFNILTGSGQASASNQVLYSSSQKTNAWDFPLLLKYRFLNGPVRPFLSAGYAWSHESTKSFSTTTCLGGAGSCTSPSFLIAPFGSAHYTTEREGPVLAAGAEFKANRVFIAPEVRVTHLTQPNINQVTMLVGFTLRPWKLR